MNDPTLESVAAIFEEEDWSARELMLASIDLTIRVVWMSVGTESTLWLAKCANIADKDGCNLDGVAEDEPVDVDKLVSSWTETIVQMSTSHSHAEWTQADHSTDDLMGPLLTAPVAQIREFSTKLANTLRDDERVPFLVWSSFTEIVAPVATKLKDGEIIQLKKDLASRVAELVEQNLDRGQLVAALAGALQWRTGSTLEAVEKNLKAGNKPRIEGRQSCLFLHVAGENGIETVVI